jgi:mannose-6-phosphate isomerase-like protein (cupin superfamily)
MLEKKFKVSVSEGNIKPEFVYIKNGITTFECRELISEATIGEKNIVVFRAIFGPREEHSKHHHMNCDEIVYCVSGRGAEGIQIKANEYKEYEYTPGVIMRLPKGVGHYTRNLDNFESLELIGIFTGVSNMDKETTGYESLGEILDHERIFR